MKKNAKLGITALVCIILILIVGFIALDFLTPKSYPFFCMSILSKEMTEFKGNLEDTVNRRSSMQFDFQPEKCFDDSKIILMIMKFEGENGVLKCSSKCGQPSDTCFVMTFSNPTVQNGFLEKCLNLPELTSFLEADECPTSEDILSGFVSINPLEKIPYGSYVLRNVSDANDLFPKVCVYNKP